MTNAAKVNLRNTFTRNIVKPMLAILRNKNTYLFAAGSDLSNHAGMFGCVYTAPLKPKQKVIVIDITSNLLGIVVHELLHVLYPNWSEQIVLKMQNLVVNTLSIRESRRILHTFNKHIRNK